MDNYWPNYYYNCYDGHGGQSRDPMAYMHVSGTEQCAALCDADYSCVAFVYMYSQQKCWFRIWVDTSMRSCERGQPGQESSEFDTFVKKSY